MSSNNEIFTPKKTYELVNQAFKIIINIKKYHIKNNKKPLNLDIIISLYKGFYAGFILLIELSDLPDYIKHDLIVKKSIVDSIYSKNIIHHNIISTYYKQMSNIFYNNKLKNNHGKYLNILKLKEKVAELNNLERKILHPNYV